MIANLVVWETAWDDSDPLVSFIQQSIDSGVPLNRLTGDELVEASKLKIGSARLINDKFTDPVVVMKALNGHKYVLEDRMLVFTTDNIGLYDISSCDPKKIPDSNDDIIKLLTKAIKNKEIPSRMNARAFLDSLIDQTRGLSFDY